jgi:NAD(P)-dependent dehydrogenase (short-subunit alcohol dehydrogenase family)
MRLSDVSLTEFLEVQVVNVTAPFMLVSRLAPLLRRSSFPLRFIVNVSAVEGQFSQNKLGVHPHTNMAKASLNMLTHTSAAELAQEGIAMNSVDPGWVSQQVVSGDEIYLPLDMLDAASRVCDPIFEGIKTEQAVSGQFYKDYRPVAW